MKLYFYYLRDKFLPFLNSAKKPIEIWEEPDTLRFQMSIDPKSPMFKLYLLDAAGRETACIRQKFLALPALYTITVPGTEKPYGLVHGKAYGLTGYSFRLRGTDLHTEGSISAMFYEIKDGERTVAKVQKVFTSKGACCETELSDDADAALIMAFIITIEENELESE